MVGPSFAAGAGLPSFLVELFTTGATDGPVVVEDIEVLPAD